MQIQTSEIVFVTGFGVYVLIRGLFEERAKVSPKILRRIDGVEWFLLVVFVGSMLLPALYLLLYGDRKSVV